MKKLFTLFILLLLLPLAAGAVNPTTLTVGGTNVLNGGYWTIDGTGNLTATESTTDYNVKYDKDSNTLTLKDATITGTSSSTFGAGIYANGDLTIVLEGSSSTVTGADAGNNGSRGIRVQQNLTIQGGGSLTAQGAETSSGSNCGISVMGSFTQQGGNVSGNNNSAGLYVSGAVTVGGGTLVATGGSAGNNNSNSYGIYTNGTVTVGSATVTATGGTGTYSYGLYIQSSSPSVTISGSGSLTTRSETATSKAGGIYFQNPNGSTGSVTVENGSALLVNSVILNENPLAPTGDGSWLIYGQSGQTSAVGGSYTLKEDLTIPSGAEVTIPAGSTLNLGGHTLTNNGTLNIANQSSLAGTGTLAGSGTFTLTNPNPVITGSENLTYDGADHFNDFNLTVPTEAVPVMGQDFAISGSPSLEGWSLETQEVKNAGTYTVTASHTDGRKVELNVTVSPATISIASATVQDKTYDGTTDATVESVTFDGLVNDESLTSGTDYTATAVFNSANAGSQTATVTVELKNGNYTFDSNSNTYNATAAIEKAPLTVTAPSKTIHVGDAIPDLSTLQASVAGLVGEDSFTGVTLTYESDPSSSIAGSYAIVPSGGSFTTGSAGNYTVSYVNGILTVEARPTYLVTVNGGTGGGEYEAGVTVSISATVPEGMAFTGWTGEGVTFADPAALNTTFTMPANAVTVTANFEKVVTGVTLNKETLELSIGGSETLTATIKPSDATNPAVTWSSNNNAVATVDANGEVTAVGAGTATITVTVGGKTATCVVKVRKPVEVDAEGSKNPSFSTSQDKFTLTATIRVDDGSLAPTTNSWKWTVADDDVVALSGSPTLRNVSVSSSSQTFEIKGTGTTTITATYDDGTYRGSVDFKVSISKPATPDPQPAIYNIYVEDVCDGVEVSTSKNAVKEGNSISVYVEKDTANYTFDNFKVYYKRSYYGPWEVLEEGVQPGEYPIRNIWTHIYVKAEGAEEKEDPTGMESIEGVKVYTKDGSLYVQTPQREQVLVISMSGAVFKNEEQVGLKQYHGLNQGIYIVRVGDRAYKVRL